MRRSLWNRISALTLAVALFTVAPGRSLSAPVSEQSKQAITALASYYGGRFDRAGATLAALQYDPPPAIAKNWDKYPAVRKITLAYRAAEHSDPGKGGRRLLAALVSAISTRYPAVTEEAALEPFFRVNWREPRIHFARPPPSASSVAVSPETKQAITALANYYSRGRMGGEVTVLRRHFNLTDADAYDVLERSSSFADALERAMTRVEPARHNEVLKNMANAVGELYPTVRDEPTLANLFRPPDHPDGPAGPAPQPTQPFSPSGAGGSSAGGGGGPWMPSDAPPSSRAMTEVYESNVTEWYPAAESTLVFETVVAEGGGFGGVVFGARVTAPGLPVPSKLAFEGDDIGSLVVSFKDGTTARFPNVRRDEAAAARGLVTTPIRGERPAAGEAIGLTGLEWNAASATCDASSHTIRETRRWTFVLHPALVNTRVGWAAVTVDALPTTNMMTAGFKEGSAPYNEVKSLLQEIGNYETYKIIDVPMTIARNEQTLVVSRSDGGTGRDALLHSSFLTIHLFENSLSEEIAPDSLPISEDFYELVPLIGSSVPEIDALNHFAPIAALYRWAAGRDAVLEEVDSGRGVRTPEALDVSSDSIRAVAYQSSADLAASSESSINACWADALQKLAEADPKAFQNLANKAIAAALVGTTGEDFSATLDTMIDRAGLPAEYLQQLASYMRSYEVRRIRRTDG